MPNSSAAKLKDEGNALFSQKKYALAAAKYTEAIDQDGENAILYANRAACYLSLNKSLDASADAKKATTLDPLYSKAWARLATARGRLSEFGNSTEAWQRAIDTLPKENLTASELTQKGQYEAGLKAALAAKVKAEVSGPRGHAVSKSAGKFPWEVALEMQPRLESGMVLSSAWIILGAYNDFSEGVRLMKALKKSPKNGPIVGYKGALDHLTNGIMRDARVFYLDDPNWVQLYNDQVMFEVTSKRAWVEGGTDLIIEQAQQRLKKEGWDSLRPALSTTVRGYIMRGFMEGKMKGNAAAEVEFITRSLEILEWGQKAWKNIPKETRGAVLEDTFVLGVRAMQLEALMRAYSDDPGPNAKFPIEGLLEAADELIKYFNEHPQDPRVPRDPSFIYSFTVYPVSTAWAMRGFYHAEMAKMSGNQDKDIPVIIDHLQKAAQAYVKATEHLPPDEENYGWYLNTALHHFFNSGAKLRETLEIIRKIKDSIPKMSVIWARSAMAEQGAHATMKRVVEMEEYAMKGLEEGQFTLDDAVMLTLED